MPGAATGAHGSLCASSTRGWRRSRNIRLKGSPALSSAPLTGQARSSRLRMYLDTFKLKELPFRLSPDPQFLYLSKAHARAKAYMESTVWFADGFVVITGEIGCGKATLG